MQDIRRIESVAGHLFAAVRRAFGRIVLALLGGVVVGGGAVEGVAYATNAQQAPTTLTNVSAIIFAVVVGYATALTVAVVETVRALIQAMRDAAAEAEKAEKAVVGDAGKVTGGAEGMVGNLVRAVEGEVKKL